MGAGFEGGRKESENHSRDCSFLSLNFLGWYKIRLRERLLFSLYISERSQLGLGLEKNPKNILKGNVALI